jgi:lipopolysaccharide biosynthesis glycosyltransferase
MIRVFIGYDERQPLSYNVLQHSINECASLPVAITALKLSSLPITRHGLTPFTFSRFLVPWLCEYEGHAIFLDADMLVTGDIAELWACKGDDDVMIVPHKEAFERPSVMLFNNERCKALTPHYVQTGNPFAFTWARRVGELPHEWNHLVGYDEAPDETPKIIHYTAGMPCFDIVEHLGFTEEWGAALRRANSIAPYEQIMGNSVHVEKLGLNRRAAPEEVER